MKIVARRLYRGATHSGIVLVVAATSLVGLVVAEAVVAFEPDPPAPSDPCRCTVPAGLTCNGIQIEDTENCPKGHGCSCRPVWFEGSSGSCIQAVFAECVEPNVE